MWQLFVRRAAHAFAGCCCFGRHHRNKQKQRKNNKLGTRTTCAETRCSVGIHPTTLGSKKGAASCPVRWTQPPTTICFLNTTCVQLRRTANLSTGMDSYRMLFYFWWWWWWWWAAAVQVGRRCRVQELCTEREKGKPPKQASRATCICVQDIHLCAPCAPSPYA